MLIASINEVYFGTQLAIKADVRPPEVKLV